MLRLLFDSFSRMRPNGKSPALQTERRATNAYHYLTK